MQIEIGPHLREEELEQYSMGRLSGDRLTAFEEHFLACEPCQDQLLAMEVYVNAVRSASPKLRKAKPIFRERFFAWPRPGWVAGAAVAAVALLMIGVWMPAPTRSPEIATILLQATRGLEGVSLAKVTAGQPAALTIDMREIASASSYRFQIVDAAGRAVEDRTVIPENGKIVHTVAKGLAAGRYFVRLYGAGGDLLREFSLAVEN